MTRRRKDLAAEAVPITIPAIPPADVLGRLAALQAMSMPELREQWRVLFGTEPPPLFAAAAAHLLKRGERRRARCGHVVARRAVLFIDGFARVIGAGCLGSREQDRGRKRKHGRRTLFSVRRVYRNRRSGDVKKRQR